MNVSVVTATLGQRPQMLAEAVASVAAQTKAPLEHLVVDDGSFSASVSGARVFHVTHRGPGAARNVGIAEAAGDAIALIDDDDLWHPRHLELCTGLLDESGADVVYSDCVVDGRRDGWSFQVRDFDAELLERQNFICLHGVVARTASLRAVGGFATGALEDWETWKKMARAGMSFVHLPQVTVTYRFHTDNLTYGGVDPDRTRQAKELREAAERGDITWDEFAVREAEVWS